MESELFGHEKGAFTGATQLHRGRFERAHGGTIFLDEVGELPPAAQVKLLRVLQEGKIERVGGEKSIAVDVRIIAATHRPLEQAATADKRNARFRHDLYYRLAVFLIHIPPLRERLDDLPALVRHLLREICARLDRPPLHASASVMRKLAEYSWPGNVRELANVLERSAIMSKHDTPAIDTFELPQAQSSRKRAHNPRAETFADASRRVIEDALAACDGRIYGEHGAARRLGLKPTTLQGKMRKLSLVVGSTRARVVKKARSQ